jgi:hypothetical protein
MYHPGSAEPTQIRLPASKFDVAMKQDKSSKWHQHVDVEHRWHYVRVERCPAIGMRISWRCRQPT